MHLRYTGSVIELWKIKIQRDHCSEYSSLAFRQLLVNNRQVCYWSPQCRNVTGTSMTSGMMVPDLPMYWSRGNPNGTQLWYKSTATWRTHEPYKGTCSELSRTQSFQFNVLFETDRSPEYIIQFRICYEEFASLCLIIHLPLLGIVGSR